ncbi:Probable RNA-directed DNA polymerase from transposon BS [Eumeta japonica]|uniref:Probable RNA-directed DNA polymerase from transposon BS n=1 Tax=Eumeta variegata TaxID=151549 RepID=A0A4C1SR18_EUMVA|nr:Probable RNA-directed DNA polymerase from transposon BS [Eumeta japonica]
MYQIESLSSDILEEDFVKSFRPINAVLKGFAFQRVHIKYRFATENSVGYKCYVLVHMLFLLFCMYYHMFYCVDSLVHYNISIYFDSCIIFNAIGNIINMIMNAFSDGRRNSQLYVKLQKIDRELKISHEKGLYDEHAKVYLQVIIFSITLAITSGLAINLFIVEEGQREYDSSDMNETCHRHANNWDPLPQRERYRHSTLRSFTIAIVLNINRYSWVILNRLRPHLDTILPEHQFGFRQKHATIEQIHRLTDTISHALETKKYCSAVFLDISQAFDRVWHDGLLFKIKKYLPHSFYFIMKSYLSERCFEVKLNNITSDLYKIRSGVPQGSILGPVLYLIFTADIPTDNKTFIATYADDTAIMSVHENAAISSSNLQKHITEVENGRRLGE